MTSSGHELRDYSWALSPNHVRSNNQLFLIPDGKYDTTIKLEYKDGVKKEDFGPDNNNTSMHLQLNIKNQNISTPQDLTLTKHDSVHYETANSYAWEKMWFWFSIFPWHATVSVF